MQDALQLCMVQMTSTNRRAANVAFLRKGAVFAAKSGCQLLALPEAAGMMNKNCDDARTRITREGIVSA